MLMLILQVILDMTFGAGGHTVSLLNHCSDITVYALDRDPLAFNIALKLSQTQSVILCAFMWDFGLNFVCGIATWQPCFLHV